MGGKQLKKLHWLKSNVGLFICIGHMKACEVKHSLIRSWWKCLIYSSEVSQATHDDLYHNTPQLIRIINRVHNY